jgi:hypothetical protein
MRTAEEMARLFSCGSFCDDAGDGRYWESCSPTLAALEAMLSFNLYAAF